MEIIPRRGLGLVVKPLIPSEHIPPVEEDVITCVGQAVRLIDEIMRRQLKRREHRRTFAVELRDHMEFRIELMVLLIDEEQRSDETVRRDVPRIVHRCVGEFVRWMDGDPMQYLRTALDRRTFLSNIRDNCNSRIDSIDAMRVLETEAVIKSPIH